MAFKTSHLGIQTLCFCNFLEGYIENNNKFEEIEKILNEYKLDGLECEYPLFSREERDTLESLCRKYNKFTSGGTDYHAKAKPNISIGTGIDNNININNEYIDSWINKVKIV